METALAESKLSVSFASAYRTPVMPKVIKTETIKPANDHLDKVDDAFRDSPRISLTMIKPYTGDKNYSRLKTPVGFMGSFTAVDAASGSSPGFMASFKSVSCDLILFGS